MDWTSWGDELGRIVTIVGLSALALAAVYVVSRRVLRLLADARRVSQERRQQMVTLMQVLRWLINAVVVVTAGAMVLGTMGVNIAPLIASAGVAGLAISLGAQTLIKDLIGGTLVLVENQYAVGDTIQVGSVWGQVERITLRTTHVRGLDGNLNFIPNGEVRIVANQTRDWSRVLVDLGVAYEEDLDRVLAVLGEAVAAFGEDPARAGDLVAAPEVLGVATLGDWAATVRVAVKTRPGQQWRIGRELRRFLLGVCEREGIELPYPRQEVWSRNFGAPTDTTEER